MLEDAGLEFDEHLLSSREEVDAFKAEQRVTTTPADFHRRRADRRQRGAGGVSRDRASGLTAGRTAVRDQRVDAHGSSCEEPLHRHVARSSISRRPDVMSNDAPFLLDVTRLIWRRWKGRYPTGIDRVCTRIPPPFGARSQAVVQHERFRRILSREASQRSVRVTRNRHRRPSGGATLGAAPSGASPISTAKATAGST